MASDPVFFQFSIAKGPVMAASVSAKRAALADLARSKGGGPSGGQIVRAVAIGIVALGLLSLIVMWLLGFFSAPPEVRAVQALVDQQIQQLERVSRNEAPFEEGSFGPMFETMRQVPREYREQAGREIGRLFEAREKAEVNSYFAMPVEQRMAEMDRRLKAEDQRRQNWESERASRQPPGGVRGGSQGGFAGGAGGPPGRGGVGGAPSGGVSSQGGGAPRGGPGGTGGPRTEESRNMRSKQRIDGSSAESRARSLEYRRLKEQRRVELGLPARGGRRG
jgi:hypothetical protein